MTAGADDEALVRLARRHRVETSYEDAFGTLQTVAPDTLVAVLRALGVPIESPEKARSFLDGEAAHEADTPPVVVAWDGLLPPLRLAPSEAHGGLEVGLALEDGGEGGDLLALQVREGATVAVTRGRLPYGVHELAVVAGGEPEEITVISAPRLPPAFIPGAFGVSAPLHGLWERNGHRADLCCLERTGRFTAALGGSYLAILPILADLSRAEEPASLTRPYSPLSRLFWNEGVLCLDRVPELAGSAPEGSVLAAPGVVDVGRRAAALAPHLAEAARRLRAAGGERARRHDAFVAERPGVLSYARFRAACQAVGTDRAHWPDAWRHGLIGEGTLDEDVVAGHVFAQFATDEQISGVADSLRQDGCGLILDLPVGCRADGYDPWAYPESFAGGASIGAPPDFFFSEGQDWGFPPLHPSGEREAGYALTRGAFDHQMRHAAAVRIDHAMSLARLWWIPHGSPPKDGAYVRYETDELLALACLAAWRHGCALVGEDLGTVEASLTDSLAEHRIAGMHVAVFDLEAPEAHPMEPLSPRPGSAALVDTHDTATFAAWYTSADIDLRLELGLASEEEAVGARETRLRARRILVDRLVSSGLLDEGNSANPVSVHEGVAAELATSEAALVLLNIEDCWGELDPQNVPGESEHANFCRPFRLDLDAIEEDASVAATLAAVAERRRPPIAGDVDG